MSHRERGMTLVEILIVSAVSMVVLAAVFTVLVSSVRQDELLRVQMEMQVESARAMREITTLLKASGPIDADRDGAFAPLTDWPLFASDDLVFDADGADKVVPGKFAAPLDVLNAQLTSPRKLTRPGTQDAPENGASTEIAFRLPEDRDGNGFLTDGAGAIEWSQDIYVICHEARSPVEWNETGNVLMLRRFREEPAGSGEWKEILIAPLAGDPGDERPVGKSRIILANWVERIQIESRDAQFYQTGNYDASLGQDQLRITLWFRRHDVSRLRERQVSSKVSTTVIFRSIDR